MRTSTKLVRAVFGDPRPGDPLLQGPVFASVYMNAGDPSRAPFTYGRTSNPTWSAYEQALAELEGGPCLVFASGMAAVSAVLCSVVRPGDVVVLPADGYYGARTLAQTYLREVGAEIRLVATASRDVGGALQGARLLLLESPANPSLDVCDTRSLCRAAHASGALVAVDNSTATVLGQQPLALGADYSLGSDSKALTGHSDLLLGHVAVRDSDLLPALTTWRTQIGAIAGPMETWLAHRSLATLDVRLQRQCGTALAVASALRDHPAVQCCRYPGLPDDPAHAVASSQMTLFGPVVGFTLAGQSEAERWLSDVRLVLPATSFGGVHTTAERRARWASDDVAPGFLRLSVGLEDPTDLVEDVLQALP